MNQLTEITLQIALTVEANLQEPHSYTTRVAKQRAAFAVAFAQELVRLTAEEDGDAEEDEDLNDGLCIDCEFSEESASSIRCARCSNLSGGTEHNFQER